MTDLRTTWGDAVRKWAKLNASDPCINNGAGRAPGDMVWRNLVRGDIAVDNNKHVVELLWDVSKAFERVQRQKLIELATDLGYPH